jgi:hypothetical protein
MTWHQAAHSLVHGSRASMFTFRAYFLAEHGGCNRAVDRVTVTYQA